MSPKVLDPLLRYLKAPAALSAEQIEDDIKEEIAFHISERARDYQALGMDQEAAHQAALARFGDASKVTVQCHTTSISKLVALHRIHLGATLALGALVAVLTFQLFARHSETAQALPSIPPSVASMLDNDWTGDVSGRVEGEHGQPIRGANVLIVVKTWPDQSYFQRAYGAITDGDGRFVLENIRPATDYFEVQAAVVTANREVQSVYYTPTDGQPAELNFKLRRTDSFTLQITGDRGLPMAGVEVIPHQRVDHSGQLHLVYFDSAQSIIHKSDQEGHVQLPYFQPGDSVTVLLRLEDEQWESYELQVPETGNASICIHDDAQRPATKET